MRWILPLLVCAQVVSAQPASIPDQFGSGSNAFTIEFVNVGYPGNAADSNGHGRVTYSYRMAKHEISQEAIDKATASGLANVTAGPWTGARPAANVDWYEAAAFVNWLNTSKGHQAAYNLVFTNGAWSMQLWDGADAWTAAGTNLYRHKNARYFLPSEDEWYKAAYHNPAGSNYFLYPTGDTAPIPVSAGTNAGTAVHEQPYAQGPAEVDAAGGLSGHGTMAQGGNILEWEETAYDGKNDSAAENRIVRGGSWGSPNDRLISSNSGQTRFYLPPEVITDDLGFRVASVPENLYAPLGLIAAATESPFDPATAANWSAGGTEWTVDTSITHKGVDSVKAQTTDGQSTYREYTVSGPVVVDFWWKVSSEQNYDTFSYSLNGVQQQAISGEVDWTYRTLTLPAGTHTIRWTYAKDGSDGIGQDAGWLDDFAVYPATPILRVRDGATVLNGSVTVDFGDADIGSAGFTKTLSFANEGYVPQEVELSLPDGSPFTFEGGSAAYSLLLGRGESLDVPVYLSTQSTGTKTAALTITAPDLTATPPQITLTGDVLGPVVGVLLGATPLTSGQTVDMGLAPKTLEFTIRNNGNVGNLTPQVSATGNFQIVQQPAASVAPQGSTTFKVLAQSGAFGSQGGHVVVTSNDGFTPTFTINLTSKAFFGIGSGITEGSVATSGTGGASGWDFATTQLPGGSTGQALKTGSTPHSVTSLLEMIWESGGLMSWSWKVSTQENFDWLLCEVNGQEVAGISTKNGVWQTQVVQVPAGATVRWVYRKDGSGSAGEDAGYLANVVFIPMSGVLSFADWAFTHGIADPNARLPRSSVSAMFAWLGGFNPGTGSDVEHYKPVVADGRLKYSYPISRTANGIQQVQFSSNLSAWTSRGMSQRVVSEDGSRIVVETVAPSGAKGFFRVVGKGDTSGAMVLIPAGSFSMGNSMDPSEDSADALPVHTVNVNAFYVDKYEVTKALWDEVANWAAANGYDINAGSAGGKAANHPAYFVTWYEAVKWCNARSEKEGLTPCYTVGGATYRRDNSDTVVCDFSANGYRLPTEAEWEKAARGGLSGKRFPWGDTISHSQANYFVYSENGTTNYFSYDISPTRGYHPTHSNGEYFTAPVGSFPANGYGLHDMAGNLWEWTWDWYSDSYYASSPSTDPRGPSSGSIRVFRGGSWGNTAYVRTATRGAIYPPSNNDYIIGFRVVRSSVP